VQAGGGGSNGGGDSAGDGAVQAEGGGGDGGGEGAGDRDGGGVDTGDGSTGEVSMSRVLEACVISSSRGGVEENRIGVVGGLFDGGVAGVVAKGGVADDGVAETGRGERINSLSSSKFRSNSNSFRLRLVRFAGGDWSSGDGSPDNGSGGWTGGGDE
jgi:hypothetical protein